MRATTLLENQHREVEALFDAIDRSDATNRQQLVNELATALAAHMVIEEETFYPMTINVRREMIPENLEEHELAASTIQRTVLCQSDEEILLARVRVLRTLIEEHIRREEMDLFPSVESAIDDGQLQAMGQQMESRFNQLIKLSPQAVLAARPTAGMLCPGQKQQPGQMPGQQPGQMLPGQQQPGQTLPGQLQPGQQQPDPQQPDPQQPGQQPGQPKGRPGTGRTR